MSNFGAKLAELLERRKMRASELSRGSGVNDGLISKWINGQQKFISNDDLASIAGVISPLARDRAELIRAHLMDELAGPGSELIDIRIRGQAAGAGALREDPVPYQTGLPLKIQRALELLARESITDADVRSVILGLAGMLEANLPADANRKEDSGPDLLKRVQKLAED